MENNMESTVKTKRRPIPWAMIGIFFSTFSVIALIILFCFAFYHVSMIGKQLQNNISVAESHINNIQDKMTSFQQETQQSAATLTESITSLRQSFVGDKNISQTLEAQYYVKLAEARLQYEHNIPDAIQLLQAADNQIHDLSDSRLDVVRQALAADIASLQALPQVDYTGLYMRLLAMDQQIDRLPMLVKQAGLAATAVPVDLNQVWWKRGLQETWQALQKIIIVRYNTANTLPLVTPEQKDFLLQNLHAIFAKAMWAVLHRQPEIYQSSLGQASEWVAKYFVVDPLTQSMLTNLSQLQKINVNPVISQLTASLQTFRDYFVVKK